MTARIQKRYDALNRTLDLETPVPGFTLLDDAVPVVMIHEHCEGPCLSFAGTITATAVTSQSLVSVPVAGAYQVVLYWNAHLAAAAQEAAQFGVYGAGSVARTALLWYFDFGFPADDRGSLLIPKLHFEEGDSIQFDKLTATLAGDFVTFGCLVQPI